MLLRDLKKNRANYFAKLQQEVDKIKSGKTNSTQTDERFWYPERDKAGNASTVIRFLPNLSEEEFPWVKYYSHGFKNDANGLHLIENCPTSIGGKCPVCEANGLLWNSGLDKNKEIARKRKRKITYISNILVVSDPLHPENEGKIFLFRFGAKIFKKISDVMYPEFEDEKPVNPFDPWEGANFKLRVRQVENYTNYDKSTFEDISAISEDEDEIDKILKQCYSLAEFVDASKFKSYNDIKARLLEVLGDEVPAKETGSGEEEEDDLPESFTRPVVTKKVQKEVVEEEEEEQEVKKPVMTKPVKAKEPVEESDDDVEAYLKGLAEED